jgi:hypothetical protein
MQLTSDYVTANGVHLPTKPAPTHAAPIAGQSLKC